MAASIHKRSPEELLDSLVNAAYDRAKFWAGIVLGIQALLFIGGVVAVFFSRFSLSYPWLAVPLAMISSALGARASEFKGLAESLKRRLENWSGFGRPLSKRLIAANWLTVRRLCAGSDPGEWLESKTRLSRRVAQCGKSGDPEFYPLGADGL